MQGRHSRPWVYSAGSSLCVHSKGVQNWALTIRQIHGRARFFDVRCDNLTVEWGVLRIGQDPSACSVSLMEDAEAGGLAAVDASSGSLVVSSIAVKQRRRYTCAGARKATQRRIVSSSAMVHRIRVPAVCYSNSGARRRRVPFSRPAANAFELMRLLSLLGAFVRAGVTTAQLSVWCWES